MSTVKCEEKPRRYFYKGKPSQKPAMIAERIEQVLRDVGVPESKIAMAATEIQELYWDIPVPVALSRSMYEISRRVFKIEFEKVFRVVESPQGKSRSTETDVSSDQIKDRDSEKKPHRENEKKTYCDSNLIRATDTQRNEDQAV
jgi:hypothetical protein